MTVQQPVYIRKYPTEAAFQADAGQFFEHGYRIAGQSWDKGGLSSAGMLWFALSAVCAVVGFLFIPLWILAILLLLVATTGRTKTLTVTYQLEPGRPG